jgi:hypothetical protein
MNELARKDLLTCLGIWLALEIVCFGLLATTGLARSQFNAEPWLIVSLPLGIGGAFLLASSTQIIETPRQTDRPHTRAKYLSGALFSGLGLVGIGFPILVSSTLIFVEIFARLRG